MLKVDLILETEHPAPVAWQRLTLPNTDLEPLTVEHGAAHRVMVPRFYARKGAKFVRSMEFLNEEGLGYWEVRGYSNSADPLTNVRFVHTDSFH